MVKIALIRSIVPVTFDGGFRSSGYEVVEMIETEGEVDIEKGALARMVQAIIHAKAQEIVVNRNAKRMGRKA